MGQSGPKSNVNESPRTPELEPHYWMQISVINRATSGFGGGGRLIPQQEIQSTYSKP